MWNICGTDRMIEPNRLIAAKRAELVWYIKTLKHASFPIHNAILPDVLSLILRLNIAFQQEEHDSVWAVRRIQVFNWTIAKLKSLTESALDGQNTHLTDYKQFLGNIDTWDDGWFYIRMSNTANTLAPKMLLQLFMAIV